MVVSKPKPGDIRYWIWVEDKFVFVSITECKILSIKVDDENQTYYECLRLKDLYDPSFVNEEFLIDYPWQLAETIDQAMKVIIWVIFTGDTVKTLTSRKAPWQ